MARSLPTLPILVLVLMACNAKESAPDKAPAPAASTPAAPAQPATAATCAAQVDDLRAFLTSVFDPAQQVPAPWPTGDAARDARIEQLRADARAAARPADPTAPQQRLTAGVTSGALEGELGRCQPARDQLVKVGEAAPDQARATMVGIADAILACDCQVGLPLVRALLYLLQRGPDPVQ
jgi:hypothetical protein